jgi:hypothetical protein
MKSVSELLTLCKCGCGQPATTPKGTARGHRSTVARLRFTDRDSIKLSPEDEDLRNRRLGAAWSAWCKSERLGYKEPVWTFVADNPDTALVHTAFNAGWDAMRERIKVRILQLQGAMKSAQAVPRDDIQAQRMVVNSFRSEISSLRELIGEDALDWEIPATLLPFDAEEERQSFEDEPRDDN